MIAYITGPRPGGHGGGGTVAWPGSSRLLDNLHCTDPEKYAWMEDVASEGTPMHRISTLDALRRLTSVRVCSGGHVQGGGDLSRGDETAGWRCAVLRLAMRPHGQHLPRQRAAAGVQPQVWRRVEPREVTAATRFFIWLLPHIQCELGVCAAVGTRRQRGKRALGVFRT
eukprot:SAG31_NODE_1511_length_8060_cov_3.005653_7_plen_169_part_00